MVALRDGQGRSTQTVETVNLASVNQGKSRIRRGRAESRKLEAEAEAEAIRLKASADAERIKLQAEAESKAQELLAKTINQDVIRLRAIEKWDGIMPRVTGEVLPFLDVEKAAGARRK